MSQLVLSELDRSLTFLAEQLSSSFSRKQKVSS